MSSDSDKGFPLTPAQTSWLQKAFSTAAVMFPHLSMRALLEGPMAHFAVGKLPPWSHLKTHKIVDTMPAHVCAFVLCYFRDPETNAIQLILGERPHPKIPGQTLLNGTGGGFGTMGYKEKTIFYPAQEGVSEQQHEIASRELMEELVYPDATPVLPLRADRLTIFYAGVDDRALANGGIPAAVVGFYHEVTNPSLIRNIKTHVRKLEQDQHYRAACKTAAKGESETYRIVSVPDALALPVARFAHPHEPAALHKLCGTILTPAPAPHP